MTLMEYEFGTEQYLFRGLNLLRFKSHIDSFLAELFRGMLFKWKGENKKSHQKWDLIVNLKLWLAE